MNRVIFMSELSALLADVPENERAEALQFYNNYFDDAGSENEANVIAELGSPQKVAATIKEGLAGREQGEYRETGYTDTRFEKKETPGTRSNGRTPNGDRTSKIILIILIVIFGAPIVLPLGAAILGVLFGLLAALVGVALALAAVAVALAVSGLVLFFVGIPELFSAVPLGLALMGSGMLLFVIGVIFTVVMVKACMVIIPGIFRGIVELFRKIFQRKAVA